MMSGAKNGLLAAWQLISSNTQEVIHETKRKLWRSDNRFAAGFGPTSFADAVGEWGNQISYTLKVQGRK
jgi:hypothetical protein